MRGTDDDGHEAVIGVVLLDFLERARGRCGPRRSVDGLVHYHDGLPVPRCVVWMTTCYREGERAYQQHGIDCTGLDEEREPSEHPRLPVTLAQMPAQQLSVLPRKAKMVNE